MTIVEAFRAKIFIHYVICKMKWLGIIGEHCNCYIVRKWLQEIGFMSEGQFIKADRDN